MLTRGTSSQLLPRLPALPALIPRGVCTAGERHARGARRIGRPAERYQAATVLHLAIFMSRLPATPQLPLRPSLHVCGGVQLGLGVGVGIGSDWPSPRIYPRLEGGGLPAHGTTTCLLASYYLQDSVLEPPTTISTPTTSLKSFKTRPERAEMVCYPRLVLLYVGVLAHVVRCFLPAPAAAYPSRQSHARRSQAPQATPAATARQPVPRALFIAVLRDVQPERLQEVAHALYSGGFRMMSVTADTPSFASVLRRIAREDLPGLTVGASSVCSEQEVRHGPLSFQMNSFSLAKRLLQRL